MEKTEASEIIAAIEAMDAARLERLAEFIARLEAARQKSAAVSPQSPPENG